MKILYILGAYKPNMSANGVCSDNVIKQLMSEGHEVTALVNASYNYPNENTEEVLKIIRVKQRLFIRMTEWCSVNRTIKPRLTKVISFVAYALNKIQLLITAPIWPYVSPTTIRRFCRSAECLYKKCKFDIVIAVYTPIEALHAGYILKKKHPELVFIPYFLDSLSGGYGPRLFPRKTFIRHMLKTEKKIFSAADKIVLMQSSAKHQLKYNNEFMSKFCILDIPMLIRPHCTNTSIININATKKLLYVGSINSSTRNPDGLIRCLRAIADEDVTCEFVGSIDCMEKFQPLKRAFGNRLTFSGQIRHELIEEKLKDADILLNIGNEIRTMVPSKIFEYMSYCKPIISTYSIDDEPSATYLRHYPLALLLDTRLNVDINKNKILDLIDNVRGKFINYNEIENKFYKNTPEAFVKLVIQQFEGNRV